jgi:hypothetical protein
MLHLTSGVPPSVPRSARDRSRVSRPRDQRLVSKAFLLNCGRFMMPDKLTLYVCHIDEGGPKPHACKRAQRALRGSGHDFEKIVFARGRLFGLFTKGRRPELKALSGQEQLPVLMLPDGSTVNGSASIIAWAKANPPRAAEPGRAD